jgi:hypothetical protein
MRSPVFISVWLYCSLAGDVPIDSISDIIIRNNKIHSEKVDEARWWRWLKK